MGKLPFEADREIMMRQEAGTSDKYGQSPYEQPIGYLAKFGIINIDKPAGPTSHEVSSYVRKMMGVKKAGHSGTLDPNVTGVLPTGIGRATRAAHPLLKAGKEYVCLMHLHRDVPEEKLMETIEEFQGEIEQMVPLRSAVKRQKRKRNIYYIDVLEIKDRDVLFKAGTQAGTYIRKLCHDIGEKLGVGAQMQELRRTKAGPFTEETLVTLQDLNDALHVWKEDGDEGPLRKCIQPVEMAVEHLPKIWILDTAVDPLCHGDSLKMPGISKLNSSIGKGDSVAVMTLKGELVMAGTAEASSSDMLKKRRGIAAMPDQVFMNPGTYPKFEK